MSTPIEPWLDEQARQEALEAHIAQFPVCEKCGCTLMNCETVVWVLNKYFCDSCARVMTNDEMREEEGID